MKPYILYIFLAAVLIPFYSCDSRLEQVPLTEKAASQFYSSENQIEEAVNGVYDALQAEAVYGYGMFTVGEVASDNIFDLNPSNDDGVYGDFDKHDVRPTNVLLGNMWSGIYKGIQRANIVLNRINDVNFEDNDIRNNRIGEVKFLRGLLYFNLVRIFGDVPIVTDEVENPLDWFGTGRDSAEEVYQLIEDDLTEAIALLPERNNANKDRAFKTSAQALLGKVYLTLNKPNEAKSLFLEVINSGAHKLEANPEDVFDLNNKLNDEIIFAVQFSSGLDGNSEGSDIYRLFNPGDRVERGLSGAKSHGVIEPELYNLYSGDDLRKGIYVDILSSGNAYSKKIAIPTTSIRDAGSDRVVLRYAEILLLLAELENNLNNFGSSSDNLASGTAIGYINAIRNRAGLGNYSGGLSQDSVYKEIDLQRRLELNYEGHRWFSLVRQNKATDLFNISAEKLLFPIPSGVIDTDDTITQNPGY